MLESYCEGDVGCLSGVEIVAEESVIYPVSNVRITTTSSILFSFTTIKMKRGIMEAKGMVE